MNKKGQFSIIAALLVAVILISTVIMTYSTIRNSPIQEQPQVLSAIDETNLALKQILGFTIGYYGSVLQVSGNTSYARMLATNYLQSGLVNIANMHPDWGTSFDVRNLDMHTYWFTNTSYSMGNLAINYSLGGLGIYGITYETACKLAIQVEKTTSSNQTQLIVTKDGDEPLINLGKQNFKFYRYLFSNSTWQLVNPSTEPIAFANGTYLIDMPSEVDPYSYVVQVEDPRGIIVVAASFNHYTCTLEWDTRTLTKYAVAGSSYITGAPNKEYATIGKGATCEVTSYQGGTGTIKQVYFNIVYYGTVSGSLNWSYRLDGGTWINIGNLAEGGSATLPLKATYNATSLRPTWIWSNLNATHIQFKNNDDQSPENAYVDAIYLTVVIEIAGKYSTIPNENIVVEFLQNGTMRWLGQNLQLITRAKPIPSIPIRAIRVNQTTNGVNREVQFQIEDWASEYRIPLGLTSNATVLSNRQMIVFLVNAKVSKITIWWDGRDIANQTAYSIYNPATSPFKNDNVADVKNGFLSNGLLNLTVQIFGDGQFQIISKIKTMTSASEFMRINDERSWYYSDPSYVIHHGIVRDIVQEEPEWKGGPGGTTSTCTCPNTFAQVVITLPANATYYTYQLRLMFVNSQQSRNITDLCPIKITTSGSPQTENGTSSGFPIVQNGAGTFYNSSSVWQHHWSQNISGTRGAGIMFTDDANKMLYAFDSGTTKTGALKVGTQTVELCPITSSVSFTSAKDLTWYGAVATFDGTTPIYNSSNKSGLWITVEYPPTITVTTES